MRRAARIDNSKKAIVQALKDAYCHVVDLKFPVDLAVRRPCWPNGVFVLMELKSGRKKSGVVRLDARQTAQEGFCATHGISYVTTPLEAIAALPLL